jgi:hypothetical protein
MACCVVPPSPLFFRPYEMPAVAIHRACPAVALQNSVLESPPMNLSRTPRTRSLTAWLLYASVLFSLFACGIHHGQMSGLSLSGLGGGFCSMDGTGGPAIDASGTDQQAPHLDQVSCPLCSSFAGAVALNSTAWSLPVSSDNATAPLVVHTWAQPPPRYSWPSLNPRASPVISA